MSAIKSHQLKIRRNQTFLRMYLFLNPFTKILLTDWRQFVQPNQLKIEKVQPIDMRPYQCRVEDRLEALAKKYKQLYINLKGSHFKTAQMMKIEEKIDYLTAIMEKFSFIEKY